MIVQDADFKKLAAEYQHALAAIERLSKQIDMHAEVTDGLRRAVGLAAPIIDAVCLVLRGHEFTEQFETMIRDVGGIPFSLEQAEIASGACSMEGSVAAARVVSSPSVDTDELRDAYSGGGTEEYDRRVVALCDELDRLRGSPT